MVQRMAQIHMEDQELSNDALLEMLQEWDDNKEGAALYKKALKEIKENAPNEPGRYRVGPYVLVVSQTKKVSIEAPE